MNMGELDQAILNIPARLQAAEQEPNETLRAILIRFVTEQESVMRALQTTEGEGA